jgi:hypothetical protein
MELGLVVGGMELGLVVSFRLLVWKNPDLGGSPQTPRWGKLCLPQTPSKGSICVKRGGSDGNSKRVAWSGDMLC